MNSTRNQLLRKKIETKEAVVGVVGLGYVGLPLAVEVAKSGYSVIGFDILQRRADQVNNGDNYIADVVDQDLIDMVKAKKIVATTDYSRIKECDFICIAVPTPLDKYHQPDISYVVNSSESVAKYIKKNTVVVLESTTYPGTTEEVVMPILEKTGMIIGKDLYLAFSPERVDPGNKVYKTHNTPKVVGGVTKECTDLSVMFYKNVIQAEIFEVSSPKVAELEKILENSFRNINIGFINEMAIMCHRMGIDIWEVIDAAKTKPYGFMPFYPGPGIGGHCIPLDPFYLTWKAREYDYHTRLIELSGEINIYMPEYTVERVMKMLNSKKKALNGAKVLIVGVAYKKDIDDLRESPALKVIEHLLKNGADISYNDPFIPEFEHEGHSFVSQELTEKNLKKYDIAILITDHTCYDLSFVAKHVDMLFDTRNATKGIVASSVERL